MSADAMEHRHLDALRRTLQAERIWADAGNEPRSFMLLHRGGMRSEVDHPGWDPSWAVPSEHTIDDLAELDLLRVEPHTGKARTFTLTMRGRRQSNELIAATATSPVPEPIAATAGQPTPEREGTGNPSALVSWAHGEEIWQLTVAEFAFALRAHGIEADADLFEVHNASVNWATYGPSAILKNDFVIIAVSRAYRERWEGTNDPGTGAGAAREANTLKGLFNEDQHAFYRKVKIVILPGASKEDIPVELKAAPQHFEIESISEEGLEDLLRTLTGQPAFPRPAVGELPLLPPKFMAEPGGAERSQTAAPQETELLERLAKLERRLNMPGARDGNSHANLSAERTTVQAALGALGRRDPRSAVQAARPTLTEREMLQLLYQTFTAVGDWPHFQYLSGRLWEQLQRDPREVYYQLSEHGFVDPIVTARQQSQLREETKIAVSLLGLTYLPDAVDDLANFMAAVRYIAERAVSFRPVDPTEVEQLTVTSEEVRLKLALPKSDPALTRLASLLRDEAWSLRTTFNSQPSGPWSMTVSPEAARRYSDMHTVIEFMDKRGAGSDTA
jgi:hypothetical protein